MLTHRSAAVLALAVAALAIVASRLHDGRHPHDGAHRGARRDRGDRRATTAARDPRRRLPRRPPWPHRRHQGRPPQLLHRRLRRRRTVVQGDHGLPGRDHQPGSADSVASSPSSTRTSARSARPRSRASSSRTTRSRSCSTSRTTSCPTATGCSAQIATNADPGHAVRARRLDPAPVRRDAAGADHARRPAGHRPGIGGRPLRQPARRQEGRRRRDRGRRQPAPEGAGREGRHEARHGGSLARSTSPAPSRPTAT